MKKNDLKKNKMKEKCSINFFNKGKIRVGTIFWGTIHNWWITQIFI